MQNLLGMCVIIFLILVVIFKLSKYMITSAVKEGTLQALIEYERIKKDKSSDH